MADPHPAGDQRCPLRSRRERIAREVGRLGIALDGSPEGAALTLDGEPLETSWLAREIPVAPGAHTVRALRDGAAVAEVEVTVRAGEMARVRLLVPAAAAGAGAGAAAAVAPEPAREVPLHEDWRLWVGVGAGVAAIAIAVAIAVAVAQPGAPADPVPGNFVPGVITW